MRFSEEWEDSVVADYLLYLEGLDPDISPMGPEAFSWVKMRELEQECAEALME